MYQTGIITDEVSQNIEFAAKFAKEYNLVALEIRSVDSKNPFDLSMDDYRIIKNVASDKGLKICAISSPLFKCRIDDIDSIRDHFEKLKHCIEAANILECKIIRGFTFFRDHKNPNQLIQATDIFQKIIPIIEDSDCEIVIESEPSVTTHNIATLIQFLDRLNNQKVMALFDPGNEAADNPNNPPFPDGYFRIKKYLRHVHLKDIKKTEKSYDPVPLGDGDVDYMGLLNQLKKDNYSGYVVVETHYRVKERLDESILIRPQGNDFSEGGYEASKIYLERLRDVYHWQS